MPKKEEPIDGEGKVTAACFFGRLIYKAKENMQKVF
jgi:hypothetical protein